MTVAMDSSQSEAIHTGAPADLLEDWSQIHWPPIEAQVKRLQMRIAKAVREGRWGKVKTLQRLLTRSFYGKLLAVKRVTENKGKRTPGVDGKICDVVQHFFTAQLSGIFQFNHFRLILIRAYVTQI